MPTSPVKPDKALPKKRIRRKYSVPKYQQRYDNSSDLNSIPVATLVGRNTKQEDNGSDESSIDSESEEAVYNPEHGNEDKSEGKPLEKVVTLKQYRRQLERNDADSDDETAIESSSDHGTEETSESAESSKQASGWSSRWRIWGRSNKDDKSNNNNNDNGDERVNTEENNESENVNASTSTIPENTNDDEAADNIETITPKNSWGGFLGRVYGMVSSKKSQPVVTSPPINHPIESELTPNKLSRVVTNTGEEVEDNEVSYSWWKPWSWKSGENNNENNENDTVNRISTTEEDELQRQLEEAANITRKTLVVRTSSYSKPSSWAFYRSPSSKTGQMSILDSKSMKEPLVLKDNIKCQFEVNEEKAFAESPVQDLSDSRIIASSVVIPNLSWNYRDLTLRTRLRILMSSMSPRCTVGLIPGETHLYHNPIFDQHPTKPIHKKALIISIHSFLPLHLVQKFCEASTSNADEMAINTKAALEKWGKETNVDMDIDTVALEGYGGIFDRVSNCLSLLDNWIPAITSSDIVLVVASMQAVATSIHVLSRLITAGYLDNASKIGLIGIKGLCLGPQVGLDSKLTVKASSNKSLENSILLELFDFQDPKSLQSKELVRHVKILIAKNVKITFLGSLTDSLAPLYSSLCLHLSHPNIYRSVYVDGESNQPDFLVTLVNLALAVKNLNMNEHQLLVELSDFFLEDASDTKEMKKGRRYSNTQKDQKSKDNSKNKHDKISEYNGRCLYENGNAYKLGIQNMMETTDLQFEQPVKEEDDFDVKKFNTNEYHLPWCVRGFVEELATLKRKEDKRGDKSFEQDTGEMIGQLLEEFRAWQPIGKHYKRLQYCIAALSDMTKEEVGGDN